MEKFLIQKLASISLISQKSLTKILINSTSLDYRSIFMTAFSLWHGKSISTALKEKNRIDELKERPLRTTVIGSYPFPGWLEFARRHLDQFGEADRAELQENARIADIHDQVAAGLDVITDGEQTRLDFNLSFYGFLEGVELEQNLTRRFGPP